MSASKVDRLIHGLIVAFMAALIWVVSGTLQQRVVSVGDSAPDFQITADDGKKISRSDFGGRLLVLNFWATWCPPCIQEMPSLDAFQQRMRGKGVVVLGISVDKNERSYREFLRRAKVSFITARDPEAEISSSYGTFKYPETYVIDREGKVLEKFIGPEDWLAPQLIARIEKLL